MKTNSTRSLNQSSYNPINIGEEAAKDLAVPKFGLVKSLQFKPEEIAEFRMAMDSPEAPEDLMALTETIDLIEAHFLRHDDVQTMANLEQAGTLQFDRLHQTGTWLLQSREFRGTHTLEQINYLNELYQSMVDIPPAFEDPNGGPTLEEPLLLSPVLQLEVAGPSLGEVMEYLEAQGIEQPTIESLRTNLKILDLTPDLPPVRYEQTIGFSFEQLKKILDSFQVGLTVQPFGILNLERLEFVPVGTERGELIRTAPLAPQETLTYSTKETTSRTESGETNRAGEGESTTNDSLTDKTEIATQIKDEEKWEHAAKISAKVGGKYGTKDINYYEFEVNGSYDLKYNLNKSLDYSIKSNRDLTRSATERSKESHSLKLTLSEVIGTEDSFVRALKNPYTDRVMRIDYYSMMRKWQVSMHRYGLRITYDMNIPEPGSEIMQLHRRLQEIDRSLAMPFEAFFDYSYEKVESAWNYAPQFWMRETNRDIARFGAQVGLRPELELNFDQAEVRNWQQKHEAEREEVVEFVFDKDPRYKVVQQLGSDKFYVGVDRYVHPELTNPEFTLLETVESDDGKHIIVRGRKKNVGSMRVRVMTYSAMQLRPEAKTDWNLQTYNHIRDAAKATFARLQENLKATRANLQQMIGGKDTLSLRRIEREELMKNVLRWMFGPGFRFILPAMKAYNPKGNHPNVDTYYDPITRAVVADEDNFSLHNTVLQHGELIKFLHQAVEWENMSYSLYPYFWSSPSEWNQKMTLKHPDPIHEAFLKAGSARVVLPLRPGFEEKFLWFLKNGKLEIPTEGMAPPYISLARQLQNHAQTNYPWLRSANPEGNFRPLLTYRQRKAWTEMEEIIRWIETYKTETGNYPTTLAQIDSLPTPPTPPKAGRKDPWGEDYHYTFPGKHADFDLASHGSNKAPGINPATNPPDPEEVDITSWADSSLVANWYEYTPTNAVDIGITTEVVTPPLPTPPTPTP